MVVPLYAVLTSNPLVTMPAYAVGKVIVGSSVSFCSKDLTDNCLVLVYFNRVWLSKWAYSYPSCSRLGHPRYDLTVFSCYCTGNAIRISSSQLCALPDFSMTAFFFAIGVMGDCAFVTLRIPYQPGWHDEIDVILPEFGRVGFYNFQQWWDGKCYHFDNESFGDKADQRQYFYEIVGSDWESGRVVAPVVAGLGFLTWVYCLSYCCSAQCPGMARIDMLAPPCVRRSYAICSHLLFNALCQE